MAEKKKRSTEKGVPKAKASKTPIPPEPPPAILEEEIAQRAYALWESRGKPIGSPEEDWQKANEELRGGM